MEDLVNNYSKPGKLVVDLFSGTFATAIVCLKLPRHRCFVGCELDSDSFAASTEGLIETFARGVLSKKSAISGTDGGGRCWPGSSSSVGFVTSSKANEILKGVCSASTSADIIIMRHATFLEYAFVSVFLRETGYNFIESAVVSVAGKAFSAGCEMLHYFQCTATEQTLKKSEKVSSLFRMRRVCSWTS